MIIYNEKHDSPILNVPAYSFIAYLSLPFYNRQQQITYATTTSIFSSDFYVDLNWFESIISKTIKKEIFINIIIPSDKKYDENLNYASGIHKYIHFNILTLDELALNLSTPNYAIKNVYYIFIGFSSWHSIVKDIYNYGINQNQKGITITGGDSSKRHLASPISIKLHMFLLILSRFNEELLINNNLFHTDKKLIIPNFKFDKVTLSPNTIFEEDINILLDKNKKVELSKV